MCFRRIVRPMRLAGLLSFAFSLIAAAQPGSGTETIAWTGGAWFDGSSFRWIDVYSAGGRLTLKRPARTDRTNDLSGRFVIPPLAEGHNHNVPGLGTEIDTYLRQGIFYVMIQGNVPSARQQYAGRINTPGTIEVVFSNGLFTAPGGHPTALVRRNIPNGVMSAADLDGGFLQPVASEADVDRAFARVAEQRPDFIKIVLTYSEDREAGLPRPDSDRHGLDPALVPAIIRKARAAGLRVSAHVESARDFEIAIAAGVDLIAHLPGFWPDQGRIMAKGLDQYRISDRAAQQAATQRASVVTTIGESLRLIEDGKLPAAASTALLQLYRDNISILKKHGVTLVIGSDQFRATSLGEALSIHRAGLMTPLDLLRALTLDAVRAIFPTRTPVGLVDGAAADFVVLPADSLTDFSAIERPVLRVKAGRPVDRPASPR